MAHPRGSDRSEPERSGPVWLQPYVLYILLTLVVLGFFVLGAYLALEMGLLPKR